MSASTKNPAYDDFKDRRSWLIAVAAPKELEAVARGLGYIGQLPGLWQCACVSPTIDLLSTGVGKANAAGAVGRVLDPDRHRGVLSVGIAGALPGSGCQLGDVVCASASVFADEGVQTPDGFESCAQMGFSPFDGDSDSIEHDPYVLDLLNACSDHIGPIACVSVCSGTDRLAGEVAGRTRAIAEAMEGAAAALAAHRVDRSLLTGEVRVISNTAGDRGAQRWDLDGALEKLSEVLGRFGDVLG